MPLLLLTLERWTADLLSQQQSGHVRFYPGKSAEISKCAQVAKGNKLADFWRSLLDARRHELHALANRVQIESILIRYQDIFK
jgi:DNA polymerase-3 subunit delta'